MTAGSFRPARRRPTTWGQYRVWGLNPGDYYVDAQARINLGFGGGRGGAGGRAGGPGGRGGIAGVIAGVIGSIAGDNVASLLGGDDDSQKAYAPTYFPGVTSVSEARAVTVGLSQESSNIDFGLQLVHVSRVTGKVNEPDGTAAWAGNVTLVADSATVGRGGGFGHQLRESHRLGRLVRDQQRAAWPLHASCARTQ